MTMTADVTTNAFLHLLQGGLWEQAPRTLSPFFLTDEEWDALYLTACRQTVAGLLYQGIERLPEALLPPEGHLLRWAAKADSIERRNRRMDHALHSLIHLFSGRQLTPVVLKGQGIARCYGQPLLRECGDIDLYFPGRTQWDEARRCVEESGIPARLDGDGSLCYSWQGVSVEHHRRLSGLCSPGVQPLLSRLERQEGFPVVAGAAGESSSYRIPSPTLNALLLSVHILKHAMGWGVGMRQLCDLARFYHLHHASVDGGAMQYICRRSGIMRWQGMLHAFLADYLALPAGELPFATPPADALPLLRRVMDDGNFGHSLRHGAGQSSLQRKWHTASRFLGHAGFACRYAGGEAFWTSVKLVIGNLR